MSLIKLIANNIELDFVKETLSIKKENNALNRDFKVSHSSIPFLIVENANTKKALGTRDLSSIKKIKTIDVIVFEGGKKYSGELQILSYLNGFRKCNLKYASSLLSIMNKKISEFMPIVSVIPGVTNPVPFTETSDGLIPGQSNWADYPVSFIGSGFPTVKWQFPEMRWLNKFGENLIVGDDWKEYKGTINDFNIDNTLFINNTFTEDATQIISVTNQNVASPQIYLLAPLFYALESIGFSAVGQFLTDSFISKILLLSSKTNLCKTTLSKFIGNVFFPDTWTNAPAQPGLYSKFKDKAVALATSGSYFLEYTFTFAGPVSAVDPAIYYLYFTLNEGPTTILRVKEILVDSLTITGSVSFDIDTPQTMIMRLYANATVMPVYSISLNKRLKNNFFQMHPTIQLGRYVPDWTFATYLNALQNMFNLEINVDDFTKKMTIDFNENTITTGAKSILKKSLKIDSYEQTPSTAFLLKYENSEDMALWITKEGVGTYGSQTSNFVERLDNKFKFVPTTYTAELSDALEARSGIGLMIYDPASFPYTVDNYLGQTLRIEGSKGIYEVFWRKFIKFLLNGSAVEMSGPFTEKELNEIILLKKIFIDNQEYSVASTESRETDQNNYEVKFNLVSVTF